MLNLELESKMNHSRRLQNAEQALELYDFGPLQEWGADGWDGDEKDSNRWTRNVYLMDPETKSESRVLFVVRFSPNDDVIDAHHDY